MPFSIAFSALMFFLIAVLPVINVPGTASAQTNKTAMPTDRFLSEYKAAITRQKQSVQNVQCHAECHYEYHNYNNGVSKDYFLTSHLMVKENSNVIIEEYAPNTPYEGTERDLVLCTTPQYAFSLSRVESDRPYLLKLISHDSTQIEGMQPTDELDMFLAGGNLLFFNPFRLPLDTPRFKIVQLEQISPEEKGSSELIALDFILNDDDALFKEGHILFAPDLNWAVLEYEYRTDPVDSDHTLYTGRNTFTPLQNNGIPMLITGEHSVVHTIKNQKQSDWNYSVRLTDFSFGTVDDSDFLLSNYGLPDSPLAAPRPATNNLIQWFLIGNGILLALIVFSVILQRFRTVPTPENL